MTKFDLEDLLIEELVFIDYAAKDKYSLIEDLCSVLEDKGFVKKSFAVDVLAREECYPTALPTSILKVAIPHAIETGKVIRPSIVVARLVNPIAFIEMGSDDKEIWVDLVMMLAVKGDKSQLEILPKLISLFSDEKTMSKMKDAATNLELFEVIRSGI